MILKTIINCNHYQRLIGCLMLSLATHMTVMYALPYTQERFEVQQTEERPQEYFVAIETPPPPKPQPEEVKVKPEITPPKPVVKPKKHQRIKQKRAVKKTPVKKPRLQKSQAQQQVAQAPQTPAPTSNATKPLITSSSSKTQVAQQTHSSETTTQNSKEVATTHPTTTGISRKQLRGIVKGYYNSLDTLMRQIRTYPRSARRLGLEGTVLVEMVVNKQGRILKVKVARSSGHDVLDQAALAQVQQLGQVPQMPNEINRSSMTFQINFDYRLQS